MSIMNTNVLVLNQSYEPMSICSARRAFMLMYLGKAEMIETQNGIKIRSVLKSYSLPSIVRLDRYIRAPRKSVVLTRKNIL
ncbi:MAG: HNH endonuclease, partial [candidate division Zixibacteria bacterium]|nr:HNH endonuclease [candidate division Zixibacteria bacterium]